MPTSVRKFCEAAIIFLLFVVLSSVSSAQTQIDLSSQSRNVDFSGARSVIPFPTGTALPPTCAPGAVFFKTDARAGSNIYACSSQDVWTLQGPASSSATWGNITGVLTNQTDLNTALSGKADTALSNLSNPSTARSNLGLGSAATQPSSAFAGSVHQHSATDITSGVVPAARLGSGTADATTVLYGDNVFRPLPAGPGGSGTSTSAAPAASLVSGAVNVTCGTPCLVNGFSFANFGGQISGFPANTTYSAYVYADNGAVKYGFPTGTTAPSTCASVTCVSGISAMPVGANIFPIAVVTLNNGTVAAVADARNAGVSQPDIIVAGAGLSSVRSGSTVTISNSVITGVSLFTGTSATLTPANIYQLVRCNNVAGCTLTLPQAGGNSGLINGTYFWVKNDSTAGIVTITPVTSTIDNAATYTLSPGQSVMVWSDGTNYLVAPGKSVSSGGGSGGATVGGTNGQIQYNNAGSLGGLTPDAANGVPTLDSSGKLKTTAFPSSYPGNAASATALAVSPTTCPAGQSPTGILANGNATGCAPNANLPASTPNKVLATDPSGSASNIPALRSLVPADLPVLPVAKNQILDPTDFSVYSVNEEFDGSNIWGTWSGGNGCAGVGQGVKGDTGSYFVTTGTDYAAWGGACNLYRNAPYQNSTYGVTPLFGGNTSFSSMSWAFRFKTGAASAGNPITAVGFGDAATNSLIQNGYGQIKPAGALTYAAILRVNTGAATTSCAAQTDAVGNAVTAGTAIPANRWHVVLSNDGYGTSFCIDTGVDAVPSTYYKFRIDVPQPGTVKFYIAGPTGPWTQVGQTYTAASNEPFLPMGGPGSGWLPLIATQTTVAGASANFGIDAFKGYIAGLNR